MHIIDRIEINYFRSIYNISIRNARDLNVFVGGNDAGKSNILRSLNLFFNNDSDLDIEHDFLSDLSRLREDEARAAKGRATIWVRITFNNFLNWKSLPKKFAVKKTWNRYDVIPTLSTDKSLSNITVAKFLNKLVYHYIPAVRARDIFEHYLAELHDALIEDEKAGVRDASSELEEAINKSTVEMSNRIEQSLNFESNIQVPRDLRELFEALDFSTKFSGYKIPLIQRGDGIQARHIPFILDFIARSSAKYHIWGYEEPENSLEMGKAFEMAEQFQSELCKENQIFVTSHSPAFYDLEGDNVSKCSVHSEPIGPNENFVTTVSPIKDSFKTDQDLGIAALVSGRARALHEEVKTLKKGIINLQENLKDAHKAQVIVEGIHDVTILNTAHDKLIGGKPKNYEFVPGQSVNNVQSFIKMISKMKQTFSVPVIGLVDNDQAGRDALKKFGSFKFLDGTALKILDQSQVILFGVLPIPKDFEVPRSKFQEAFGKSADIPLFLENLFPPDLIAKAIEAEKLVFIDKTMNANDGELSLPVNITENYRTKMAEGYEHWVSNIDDNCKASFAEWLKKQDKSMFIYFNDIFEMLDKACAMHETLS